MERDDLVAGLGADGEPLGGGGGFDTAQVMLPDDLRRVARFIGHAGDIGAFGNPVGNE